MYQKNQMQQKNLKKHKKHMQFYQIKKKEGNMISLDINHLIIWEPAHLLDLILVTLISVIFLMIYLVNPLVLQVENHQQEEEEEMI